jgi:NitT/TauT family transport system permease protein
VTAPATALGREERPPRRRRSGLALSLAGTAVLLGAWEIIGRLGAFGNTWPPFTQVASYLASPGNRALFGQALASTAAAAGLGYLLGTAAAITAAVVTDLVPFLQQGVDRIFAIINALPLIALGPVFIVTIGRDQTPVAVAALAVAFTMFVAVTSGLRRERPVMTDLMKVLGSSRWALFRHIRVPASLPTVADGLTLAAPAAVLGAVIGEWFGTTQGLGVLIVSAMSNFQIDLLWAAALLCAALSLAAFGVLRVIEHLVTRRFT